MTRVSEALRRVRGDSPDGVVPAAQWAAEPVRHLHAPVEMPERDDDTEDVWHLAGAARDGGDRVSRDPEVPVVVAGRAHRAAPAGELSSLVERVFVPWPSRRVGFAAAGPETVSGPLLASVAELLATTGARVCAVDANFARPSLHTHFGVTANGGLMGALAAGQPLESAAQRVAETLWVIPAAAAAAPVALGADSAQAALAELMDTFDYVLVDLEPPPAASRPLMRQLAGVVLVIDAVATHRRTGRTAATGLRDSGVEVIGAVLTNRGFPVPEALYRRL